MDRKVNTPKSILIYFITKLVLCSKVSLTEAYFLTDFATINFERTKNIIIPIESNSSCKYLLMNVSNII